MARRIPEDSLQAIMDAARRHPHGVTAGEVADSLPADLPRRTLQYRLKALVEDGRLLMTGSGRWARYRVPAARAASVSAASVDLSTHTATGAVLPPLSDAGTSVREYVRQPELARDPVGYDAAFLDSYRPNESCYLSSEERARLHTAGTLEWVDQPAGTFARNLLGRLLIPLSWNSSRLEGNTYSLLETHRLIEVGEEGEGRDRREAQMILNHKDAIEFLVESGGEIGFNRYTLLNLHAALADGLLDDPRAPGRLRRGRVGIGGSVFHPLEVPQLIEERFDRVLATAERIEDPFEQALFAMVHLPYLQPFDDVNKRVSRLAANIPLIRANLAPLSFDDLPSALYTEAILGVYELKRTELLRDVFLWAYERSAALYGAVRQSLGEPDPFRMRHRSAVRELVGTAVRERMDKRQAGSLVRAWASRRIDAPERERFREIAERELLGLHPGNFARYRITPSEFDAWRKVWRG